MRPSLAIAPLAQSKIPCLLARVAASFCCYGYESNRVRASRSAGGNRLAGETSQGRRDPSSNRMRAFCSMTPGIPNAVHIDWRADPQDPVIRDYISPEKFARLCSRSRHHAGHHLHFLRRRVRFKIRGDKACRGRRRQTMMLRSSQPRNWQRSISSSAALALTKTRSVIAESASARVTPGLCLPTC